MICDNNQESLLLKYWQCAIEVVNVVKISHFFKVIFNGEVCYQSRYQVIPYPYHLCSGTELLA